MGIENPLTAIIAPTLVGALAFAGADALFTEDLGSLVYTAPLGGLVGFLVGFALVQNSKLGGQ